MVFVKVRETYDLHTVQNKMTVIAIHTPHPDILKANFPGLLMQCKAYRPVSADVKVACASVLPLDPQGVGLAEGDVAPEDVFNPILYKACSNFGMSQIEARIAGLALDPLNVTKDVTGASADVDVDTVTTIADEFPIYYGLLSNAHGWKHANPQSGLHMEQLRPLVYEMLYNVGDNSANYGQTQEDKQFDYPSQSTAQSLGLGVGAIRGNAKPLPFINCTSYSDGNGTNPFTAGSSSVFPYPGNNEIDVPWINCVVGAIIVPPSRLHELFYRMVVEWTIEFSMIRPLGEITNWVGLTRLGGVTHYQNYSYEATKQALTGDKGTILENDSCMVSANVDVQKVM